MNSENMPYCEKIEQLQTVMKDTYETLFITVNAHRVDHVQGRARPLADAALNAASALTAAVSELQDFESRFGVSGVSRGNPN